MMMIRERGTEMSMEKVQPNGQPSYQPKELKLGTGISAKWVVPLGINVPLHLGDDSKQSIPNWNLSPTMY